MFDLDQQEALRVLGYNLNHFVTSEQAPQIQDKFRRLTAVIRRQREAREATEAYYAKASLSAWIMPTMLDLVPPLAPVRDLLAEALASIKPPGNFFRGRSPFSGHTIDFWFPASRIAVQIGDEGDSQFLESQGCTVLRFSERDVRQDAIDCARAVVIVYRKRHEVRKEARRGGWRTI